MNQSNNHFPTIICKLPRVSRVYTILPAISDFKFKLFLNCGHWREDYVCFNTRCEIYIGWLINHPQAHNEIDRSLNIAFTDRQAAKNTRVRNRLKCTLACHYFPRYLVSYDETVRGRSMPQCFSFKPLERGKLFILDDRAIILMKYKNKL